MGIDEKKVRRWRCALLVLYTLLALRPTLFCAKFSYFISFRNLLLIFLILRKKYGVRIYAQWWRFIHSSLQGVSDLTMEEDVIEGKNLFGLDRDVPQFVRQIVRHWGYCSLPERGYCTPFIPKYIEQKSLFALRPFTQNWWVMNEVCLYERSGCTTWQKSKFIHRSKVFLGFDLGDRWKKLLELGIIHDL